jgi:hypothetical protein
MLELETKSQGSGIIYKIIYNIFIAQKVSNIHLVTKDYKIVPLTNLLGLLLPG